MADRALELQAAFDRGFAEALRGPRAATTDLLRVRLDGAPYVVRLSEVAALHVDLPICAVPTPARELLGVAAIRSALVPIYDLRALLGAPTTHAPRWCAVHTTVGFAFDGFDGLLRVETIPNNVPVLDLGALAGSFHARWFKER